QPDERCRVRGRAGARILPVPLPLSNQAGPAPAVLARPRDAGPAALEHAPLPGEVVVPALSEVDAGRPRAAWHIRLEPGARVSPARLPASTEADIHRASLEDQLGPRPPTRRWPP